MADKRISQLIERVDIANNDVLPIVASGATTTNKVTVSTLQTWMQDNLDVGVTSVGLSMPSAFVVSNSPVTASGNISVTGAGTVSQYIRGDGSLADFPSGGGGGGASVNYYLNGSVSQGTIGGIAYQEMNKVPVLGAGTDFTIAADGYIASFITDVGDPNLLQIPAGNWNFETYLQASSGGGTPSFYIELYKVSYPTGTATLIASNSATPELIAFGTTTTPYFSALAVPTTSLALTDRLALRYYVTHSGRTITLHTENTTLCQIVTTFTTGLTALNGLTAQVQNLATGTSGTNFAISSSGSTHTFNLPTASATNRGALSSADWTTFNNKQNALGFTAVPTTRTITINGTSQDLSANRTYSVGTVTSVAALTLGTTGTDLSSSVATGTTTPVITLNVPTASATNRGALSSADWITFNSKEGSITAGTTSQYYRGDKTFQTLNTAAVPELTNLYFTTARVLATALTGYAVGTNTALAATDTILGAFGKVQAQINAKQNALTNPVTGTGTSGRVALWSGTNAVTSDAELTYNSTTNLLTIGGGITLTGAQTIQTSTGNLTLATAAGNGNIVLSAHGDGNVTTNDSIFIGSNSGIDHSGISNKLSVASTGYNLLDITKFSNDNFSGYFYIGKSRGSTVGNYTIVQNGDQLGSIIWQGSNGTSFSPAATISAEVDGVPGSSSDMPGRLIFATCSDNSTFAVERLRISSTGAATFSSTARIEGQFLQVINATQPSVYINNTAIQWRSYLNSNNYAISDAVRDVLTLGYNGSPSFFQGCNVGIGTASALQTLTLAGTQMMYNTAGDGNVNTIIGSITSQVRNYGTGIATSSFASIQFATDPISWFKGNIRFLTNGSDGTSTGGTERMQITSDGYARLSANSGGIQFNGDTAAANALDDYEEGTWTPVLSSAGATPTGTTYTERNATYTKVGRAVTVTGGFLLSNKGTGGSGETRISGLPFTQRSTGGYGEGTASVKVGSLTTAALASRVDLFAASGASYLRLRTDQNDAELAFTEITNTTYIKFTCTYFV